MQVHNSPLSAAAPATAPTIAFEPTPQSTLLGEPAYFLAGANGVPTPTVQWQISADNINFVNIPGQTSTQLDFTPTAAQNQNYVRAVFTNSAGTATTNAVQLTVLSPPAVNSPTVLTPTVVTQGAKNTYSIAGTFSESVGANATDFSGILDWGDASSNSTLTISGSNYSYSGSHTYASSGNYQVTISIYDSDGFGTASAQVTVIPTITITAPAGTATVGGANGSYTFTRTGNTGNLPVNFQLDPSSTANATQFTLSGAGVTFNAATGAGMVTIADGSTSASITLVANANTTGIALPGQTVQLDVAAGTAASPGTPGSATVTIQQNGFVVFNTNDSGAGSLRQAVDNANTLQGNPTITFDPSVTGVITLAGQPLYLQQQMTIRGPGAKVLSISGNNQSRIFSAGGAFGQTISGLTFINGNDSESAGVAEVGAFGVVILSYCEITQNSGDAGAFYVLLPSTMVIDHCTICNNSGPSAGAIFNEGTLIVLNSTISGNQATESSYFGAGGIATASSNMTCINATITGNRGFTAGQAGGLNTDNYQTQLFNTIIAGNFQGSSGAAPSDVINGSAAIITASHTLIGDAATAGGITNGVNGNIVGITDITTVLDPMLADNGGPTLTHALASGSPAINAGATQGSAQYQLVNVFAYDGTFTLSYNGATITSPLVIGANPSDVQAALNALPTIGGVGGTITVTNFPSYSGSSYLIVFGGTLALNSTMLTAVGSSGAQVQVSGLDPTGTDQRGPGYPRQVGSAVDIGAVEQQAFTPTVTNATTNENVETMSGLVITPNISDGGSTTYYQITGMTGGTLFQNDGVTAIANGGFITVAQGAAGLKFLSGSNLNSLNTTSFGFGVQASTSAAVGGLHGDVVTAVITVNPVAHIPSVTNAATTENTQTTSGLVISRNAVDGGEVAYFEVSHIQNGTLYLNDGVTALSNGAFITYAQGNAGLKFTPATNFLGQATFQVQASIDNGGTGISPAATATIIVGTVNPTVTPPGTPATLNKQTGLYQLAVTVTNTTPGAIYGFRLHVDYSAYLSAYPTLKLYNASSAPGATDIYVDYPYAVAQGATVSLNLEFYTSDRQFPTQFTPNYSVTLLAASETATVGQTGTPVSNITRLADHTILLQWSSIATHWYKVSYSTDMLHWYDCPTPIQAGSNRMQWLDNGPPFTSISPADASVTARFYIVNEIPTP